MFSSFKVESPEEKLPPKSQDPPPIHYLEFIYTGLAYGLCKLNYNISLSQKAIVDYRTIYVFRGL